MITNILYVPKMPVILKPSKKTISINNFRSYLLVGLKIKRALALGIGLTLLVMRISDILRGRAVD